MADRTQYAALMTHGHKAVHVDKTVEPQAESKLTIVEPTKEEFLRSMDAILNRHAAALQELAK